MTRRRFAMAVFGSSVSLVEAAPPLGEDMLELFRVVEDADGYVNVRSGASTSAPVLGRVATGCAVAVGTSKGGWRRIEDETGAGKTLYIHGSRLKEIGSWKQTRGRPETRDRSASVEAGGLRVRVVEMPFDAGAHRLVRPKAGEDGQLTIDGHRVIGTDGEVPSASLVLEVTLRGKPVVVPAEATRDLYEPRLGEPDDLVLLTPGEAADHALVFLWGSDGAGGYAVSWSFWNGRYVGRAVYTGF